MLVNPLLKEQLQPNDAFPAKNKRVSRFIQKPSRCLKKNWKMGFFEKRFFIPIPNFKANQVTKRKSTLLET